MSNKMYDTIKNIGLLAVPLIAFIASLCTIWEVPHCAEITASLTALDTFIGAIVIVAKKIYDGGNSNG